MQVATSPSLRCFVLLVVLTTISCNAQETDASQNLFNSWYKRLAPLKAVAVDTASNVVGGIQDKAKDVLTKENLNAALDIGGDVLEGVGKVKRDCGEHVQEVGEKVKGKVLGMLGNL
ncbi:hypothetical protein EGW08_009041 [Elysia chlorotica]|uniref:Uncharacterized protein n=1 Tax=Elysia chlorotica TaxID=188477 RepID=A0A433TNN6_ELYCH|nr:hypothetical protein EGW08_009041 [Elysia chlorotica]